MLHSVSGSDASPLRVLFLLLRRNSGGIWWYLGLFCCMFAFVQQNTEIHKLKQDIYTRDAIIGRWEHFASTLDGLLVAEGLSHAAFVSHIYVSNKIKHGICEIDK